MAYISLDVQKLRTNYEFLKTVFSSRDIKFGVVSKLLCGTKMYIEELVAMGVREIHDSRISNLKVIKAVNPEVFTVYIKPPAKKSIANVVKYADMSFNTEYETIKMLSDEAVKQRKIHQIIIMIEMGDLREGVLGPDVVEFYASVMNLPNIAISGIGTNLHCLSGVVPSQDKLIQLSLYKQLIEAKLNVTVPLVSGGTSAAVSLLLRNADTVNVNHFRIGEILYFGKDLFSDLPIEGMETDVFKLYAEIIEITEKPVIPIGELAANPSGNIFEPENNDLGNLVLRAIVDVGLLDMRPQYLEPEDESVKIIDASSDMLVIDITNCNPNYAVGDVISFNLKYMGALYLLNSYYVEKVVKN